MRICFLPIGDIARASSRIRVFQIVDELRNLNYDCDIERDPINANIVVFQRRYSRGDFDMAGRCKGKVIFDQTDADWVKNEYNEDCILKMADISDVVTVASTEQSNWFKLKGFDVVVIPCGFDFNSLPKVEKEKKITLCWTGSSKNEKYLEMLVNPLNKLKREFDFNLKLVCDINSKYFPKFDFNPEMVQWNIDTDLKEVAKCHIGLSPLFKNDDWCRYKPSTKVIIYMALGLATVASPIPSYKEVIDSANGVLAKDERDWYSCLRMLIEDESMRNFFVECGFRTALRFGNNEVVKQWANLFETIK